MSYCECGAKLIIFVNAKKRGRISAAQSAQRGHDLCHKCFVALLQRANQAVESRPSLVTA